MMELGVSYPANNGRVGFRKRETTTAFEYENFSNKALEDINFTVSAGDRLGVIGLNGAGKSTFLKVACGILPPTSGSVEITGQVTPILNSNLGMDISLSGADNVVIRGMLIGLSEAAARESIDLIADWTELGYRISHPLNTYSDGMRARLAFAINTYTPADILIIDEGIGAGDAAFQQKAQIRLEQFFKKSNALVVASHSMNFLSQFVTKLILLHKGRIIGYGDYDEVSEMYNKIVLGKRDEN
jgi:ABC-2 type transport system ATP-binding protein